jgi:hypothetical protein
MITGEIQALGAHYRQVYTPGDTVVLIQLNMNSVTADLHSSDFFPYSIYLSSSQIDESYEPVGNSLFFKTSVSDPSNWKTWKIVQGVASSTELQTGVAIPNPFRPPDPRSDAVYIAAQASQGTLYIYNSSMNLVFQASQSANVSRFGKPVFWWSGNTSNNSPAQTGIYIFVLALPDRTLTGKIALIRK